MRRYATGARNGRWNPDRMVSSHGYVKVRVGLGHPLADSRGSAYEHLIVWRAAGRRSPRADQLLHHRDGNKQNNQLGNLEMLTRSEHARGHAAGRRRAKDGTWRAAA